MYSAYNPPAIGSTVASKKTGRKYTVLGPVFTNARNGHRVIPVSSPDFTDKDVDCIRPERLSDIVTELNVSVTGGAGRDEVAAALSSAGLNATVS